MELPQPRTAGLSLLDIDLFPSSLEANNQASYIPDGHFKFPHLWPGQNPPGDS